MAIVEVSPKAGLTCRELNGELIVLDSPEGFVHHLNPSGALIWSLLDGCASIQEIAACLAEEFELDAKDIDQDVKRFIDDLERMGLLETKTGGGSEYV
jgi:PqqD family protein of HPr-rel-A system